MSYWRHWRWCQPISSSALLSPRHRIGYGVPGVQNIHKIRDDIHLRSFVFNPGRERNRIADCEDRQRWIFVSGTVLAQYISLTAVRPRSLASGECQPMAFGPTVRIRVFAALVSWSRDLTHSPSNYAEIVVEFVLLKRCEAGLQDASLFLRPLKL